MADQEREEELMEQLKEIFKLFAANEEDDAIPKDQFGTVMRSMGINPTESELQDMLNELDADGRGTISFDEFVNVFRSAREKSAGFEDELREAFKVFDKDGNGFVDATELKEVLCNKGAKLTDEEAEDLISSVDMDQDGHLNYEEFVTLMTAK